MTHSQTTCLNYWWGFTTELRLQQHAQQTKFPKKNLWRTLCFAASRLHFHFSSLLPAMFSAYELGLTYSRNLLTVPLGVLKVWGSPAPLPTPFPSSWTLQNPQCQRLIQLQHGLPVRQRTVLIQFHIQGARSFLLPGWKQVFQKCAPVGSSHSRLDLSVQEKLGK